MAELSAERGQASVELVGGLPAMLLTGLIVLQFLAVGYSLTLVDGAAESAALALAAGRSPAEGARAALPGWARSRVGVEARGGRVTVRLLPPSPIAALARRLAVSSSAWARPKHGLFQGLFP